MKKRLIIAFFLILPLIVFIGDICDLTQYIKLTINYDWLSFFGSIYASGITILGIFWTLQNQKEEKNKKRKEEFKPHIIIDCKNKFENKSDVTEDNNNIGLTLKNVGKETAKNINCRVKIKDLEANNYDGIKIHPEIDIIYAESQILNGYIRNSEFNILALQKDESKVLEVYTLERIINLLGESVLKKHCKEIDTKFIAGDYKNLERILIIEIDYQDLIGEKYNQKYEILFSPSLIYMKEGIVLYAVTICI